MKTVCYIAHPELQQSSSQQYLLQSGLSMTEAEFVNLAADNGNFSIEKEVDRLKEADQIILQFPLYWYQAPSQLFEWINQVWTELNPDDLQGKYLGLVVVVGGKKEHYQAGGREGRTLSELLSNFEVLAKHFKMTYKPLFSIHQFQYMNEREKSQLMWHYLYYLESFETASLINFQKYILNKAKEHISPIANKDNSLRALWETFINQMEIQAMEIEELMFFTKED